MTFRFRTFFWSMVQGGTFPSPMEIPNPITLSTLTYTNNLLTNPIVLFTPLRYTHWFDGMAMMHRFHIRDGDVTYSSRFLRSDSYVHNSEKNRIVVSEFGTVAMPDPCKNIFARFFSRFQIPSMCGFFTYCIFPSVVRLSTPAVQNAPFKVFSSFVQRYQGSCAR